MATPAALSLANYTDMDTGSIHGGTAMLPRPEESFEGASSVFQSNRQSNLETSSLCASQPPRLKRRVSPGATISCALVIMVGSLSQPFFLCSKPSGLIDLSLPLLSIDADSSRAESLRMLSRLSLPFPFDRESPLFMAADFGESRIFVQSR